MAKTYLQRLTVLLLVSLLGACATNAPMPAKDRYEPTIPRMPYTPPPTNGSIYQDNTAMLLFEDRKALRVGDILTVVLQEKTDALKSSSTSTSKETSIDTGIPTLFGRPVTIKGTDILSIGLDTNQTFDGSGDSEQRNSLSGTISVTVSEVLPNRYLVVLGQKRLQLNQGEEVIRISGIVRPEDVGSDNTISSTLLANAQISYVGTGALADANEMGWLTKFFNSGWWPF